MSDVKTQSKTMTLLQLIASLAECAPDASLSFDFCAFKPGRIEIFFEDCDSLAIVPERDFKNVTVEAFIATLKNCVGATFKSYGCGGYMTELENPIESKMTMDTPIWVSFSDAFSATAIVGVKDKGDYVILKTDDPD
jgi:hypothetical protein